MTFDLNLYYLPRVINNDARFKPSVHHVNLNTQVMYKATDNSCPMWISFLGLGCYRIAIMMIFQCYKTKNLALNQQTLWESISLFQLNKISFPDLSLRIMWLLFVNNWAAFFRIEKTMQLPSFPTPNPLPQSKTDDCTVPLPWIYGRDTEFNSREW